MNTIDVKIPDESHPVTYNEAEVLRFIQTNKNLKVVERDTIYKVRDFFTEREWSDSETTVNRDEVNDMLRSIGAEPIRIKWTATIIISATVSGYEAEDEEDAVNCIEEDISLELDIGSGAEINIEGIEVSDLEIDE